MNIPDPHDLISLRAAGRLIGFSAPTIRRWIDENKLTEYRVGDHAIRVDRNEVLSLIVRVSEPATSCPCTAGLEVAR